MPTRHYIAILTSLLILLSSQEATSRHILADVLQARHGEVCLNAGTDSLIFPGCRFTIFRGTDSIAAGVIWSTFRTVAIGGITDGDSNAVCNGCRASVETAVVDSFATLILRTPFTQPSMLIHESYAPVPPSLISKSFGDAATPQIFKPVDSLPLVSAIAAYDGDTSAGQREADVFVGAGSPSLSHHEGTSNYPAPFIVALIPNLSSRYNARGELTTSLYERFDAARNHLYAPGMEIQPINSFLMQDTSPRAFPYDLEQARRLFRAISPRPKEIIMLQPEPILQPLAAYLADLLARDQCRVRIERSSEHWDFALSLVPYSIDSHAAVQSVIAQLARDTTAKVAADAVRSLLSILNSSDVSADSLTVTSTHSETHSRLDRMLMADYGCFPLFRPNLVAHMQTTVRDVKITDHHKLDFRSAFKIILPGDSARSAP